MRQALARGPNGEGSRPADKTWTEDQGMYRRVRLTVRLGGDVADSQNPAFATRRDRVPVHPPAYKAQMEDGVEIEEDLNDDKEGPCEVPPCRQGKADTGNKQHRRPEMGCFGRLYESEDTLEIRTLV